MTARGASLQYLPRMTGEGDHEVVEGALSAHGPSAPSVSPLFGVDPSPPRAAATGEDLDGLAPAGGAA